MTAERFGDLFCGLVVMTAVLCMVWAIFALLAGGKPFYGAIVAALLAYIMTKV